MSAERGPQAEQHAERPTEYWVVPSARTHTNRSLSTLSARYEFSSEVFEKMRPTVNATIFLGTSDEALICQSRLMARGSRSAYFSLSVRSPRPPPRVLGLISRISNEQACQVGTDLMPFFDLPDEGFPHGSHVYLPRKNCANANAPVYSSKMRRSRVIMHLL